MRFLNGRFIFWAVVISSFILFFLSFSGVCFPFAVGFVLAYLCTPFTNEVSRYVNRTLISFALTIGLVCVFIWAGVELIPRLKEYLLFIANNAPACYDRLAAFLEKAFPFLDLGEYKSEIALLKGEIQKYLDRKVYIWASVLEQIASKRDIIAAFFSFFVTMPISFFYFLRDWNRMTEYMEKCVPVRHKQAVIKTFTIIRITFVKFFRGQLYVVAILSCCYIIVLRVISVNNSIFLGILSGMFSFIPFIGALFSCLLVIFMSAPMLTLTKLYVIIATYLAGQVLEGYILSPRFVGKRIGLHPLWILFSFFAGLQAGGIIGVLIAIPLAAVIRNLAGFTMRKFKGSQAYKQ
ncbi:MAG: AI-2E family transporter [Holosporaceae bacterium]|nr:AI-2E family transporter [Holosporaceae bacterium]